VLGPFQWKLLFFFVVISWFESFDAFTAVTFQVQILIGCDAYLRLSYHIATRRQSADLHLKFLYLFGIQQWVLIFPCFNWLIIKLVVSSFGVNDLHYAIIIFSNFCRILTMVCWYWANCTFGLYPSSGVSKNWGIKYVYQKNHHTHVQNSLTRKWLCG
jgi:hypothetical protein